MAKSPSGKIVQIVHPKCVNVGPKQFLTLRRDRGGGMTPPPLDDNPKFLRNGAPGAPENFSVTKI